MNVLALDLGTHTGFAIERDNGEILYGAASFALKANESRGLRFHRFQEWLDEKIKTENINLIAFEDVRSHKGTQAAHIYGAFKGILLATSERCQIRIGGIPVTTIKKTFTGNGRASKHDMIKEAEQRGFRVARNHDAADALGVLFSARRCLGPEQDGFITMHPEVSR